MNLYKYRAINRDGDNVKGTIEAADKASAIIKLKDLKYTPLSVSAGNVLDSNIEFRFLQKVKMKDLAIFSKQFSILLDAGIAVLAAIDILKRQTENKKLKNIIGEMQTDIQKGFSLNASMRKHKDVFPDIMLNVIEAGETTGNLEDSFEKMAVHFDKEMAMSGKLKGSLTYAIILGVITVAVITIMLVGVVPNFVSMFESAGAELPFTTKTLLSLSDFVVKRWYIILIIIVVLVVGFKIFVKTEQGKLIIDKAKIKLPAIGDLNKKIVISRFARILSSLVGSGLPLFTSLEIVSRIVGNKVYQKTLEKIRQAVGNGLTLTQAMSESDLFMKMVVQMIKVGEDTGRLETVLDKIADFYDEEIEEATAKVAALMEPALIMVLAVVVGFIVLSLVQPMFGMMNTIQ